MQAVYVVKGMTCGHCASSVTEEVSLISAVREVQVDLTTGHVTVSSESALDIDEVTRAVSEAGYELTGRV
nr:heavy-metal-associated domain-containing protein [Kibdelosporangium sp. MJ126-NF4]